MKINSDYIDLLKDKDVRYLLQRINNELERGKTTEVKVYAKVPSYTGKVELFNKHKPVSNDEYFLQLLINDEAIKNIKFEAKYPNKNKDEIDDLLLETPEELKTPYVSVSFDMADRQSLKELCDAAVDIFILNPYSPEEQGDIVLATINVAKGQIKNENITLTWSEFASPEDARRIQIVKTLKNLNEIGLITIRSLNYNLLNTLQDGRIEFQANLICKVSSAFLSKHIREYKSLRLDTYYEIAYYPRLGKWVEFDKRHGRKVLYEILKAFVLKEGEKSLTDMEMWKIIEPRGKKSKKIQFHQLDKIIDASHRLNVKFKKKDFIKRNKARDGYYLNP